MDYNGTAAIKKRSKRSPAPKGTFLRFLLSFFSAIFIMLIAVIFLLYGPFTYFRDELVTKAMGTMTHQWIASFLFDQDSIAASLARNKTIESGSDTDPNEIKTGGINIKDNATALPDSPSDGERIIDGVGFIRLKGSTYDGWAVKVYDPSRVYMQLAKGIGEQGERISSMCKRMNAFVGINAGGFADIGGQGTGGLPTGVCIVDGQMITTDDSSGMHNIIAFDRNNKLILGRYTFKQIKAMKFKDALEFRPFLIVNGVRSKIVGNGGYGTDPRTAIGQTKNGVLVFIVINGRRVN
ncbi:MAG: phosphodiester glycosidase family protein, partial [Clostridia bacterium]|nr:phosphodiester glycosidase family protein [Clostridia bacterium]